MDMMASGFGKISKANKKNDAGGFDVLGCPGHCYIAPSAWLVKAKISFFVSFFLCKIPRACVCVRMCVRLCY